MKRILSLYFTILFTTVVFSQSPHVETISMEQGLSQGFIFDICQDTEGFIWFGTKNGLNRYDGYEFLVFKNDPYDPFSIPDNYIYAICEAGDFIFIISNTGIGLFHRRTRRYFAIPQTKSIPAYHIAKCRTENDNTVWLSLYQEGNWRLYRCSWPKEVVTSLALESDFASNVSLERMFSDRLVTNFDLSHDRKTLWLAANRNELFRMDLPRGDLEPIQLGISDVQDMSLLAIGNGNNAVCGLDGKNRAIALWDPYKKEPGAALMRIPVAQSEYYAMLNFDAERQIFWVASGKEVWGFDMNSPSISIREESADYVLKLDENANCAFTDRNGILWIGTNAKGIRKFNPNTRLFKNYYPGQSIVSPIFADKQGNIWISLIRNSLIFNQMLNLETGHSGPYPLRELASVKRESRGVVADDGSLYLTAIHSNEPLPQLIHYNPMTGQKDVFQYPIPFNKASAILYFDSLNQVVWTALNRNLIRFDVVSQKFSKFELEILPDRIGNVNAIAQTADGSLWLAYNIGLLCASPLKKDLSFQLFLNDPSNRNSLPGNYVKSLLVDPDDNMVLWIGTDGYGLCRFDLRLQLFSQYNTRNGLPDDVVYGILAETVGQDPEATNLWLSTNNGLIRFNPTRETFRHLIEADGLQGNEFNTYAYGMTTSGEMMFGGVNGLTVFDPKALREVYSIPASVLLTKFRVNKIQLEPRKEDGLLQEGIEFSKNITLSHKQNNLYIQFMSTDLSSPKRTLFRYYLDGAETEWEHSGFENTAQYLNLSPGSYEFKVNVADGDGIWNDKPTVLHIQIYPPWYASWWAFTFYGILLIFTLHLLYRFQINRKLEHAETHRLKELNTLKSRLFTNIAHEFRTPLTVILGMADQLRQNFYTSTADAMENNVEMLKRNGKHLLKLINQVLDLAKLESGSMQLNLIQDDAVGFIKYIVESNQSYSGDRQIQIYFESDIEFLLMDFDREKLQSIVSNLLSNAVKFSHPHGKVEVQLRKIIRTGLSYLEFCVQDFGVGIPEEQLERIFERFYQVDNSDTRSGEGTGIGLALVQELIKLMNGSIQIESHVGNGTSVKVVLPIRQELKKEESHFALKKQMNSLQEQEKTDDTSLIATNATSELPLLLVVEDNEDVRTYIVSCLQQQYQVLEAINGLQGIEKALETVPDLIISDVMMPIKDGFEVCDTLKHDIRTSHVPIVMLTAKATMEDRISGLRKGADAYLLKPFHQEELLLTLSNLLDQRRKWQERFGEMIQSDSETRIEQASDSLLLDVEIEQTYLDKINMCIEEHLGDAEFDGPGLAKSMLLSNVQLYRKIKALTGKSTAIYIRSVRLQKGMELLQNTELNISTIAYEVGFNDPYYFSRTFSKEFGVAPSEIRK